MIHFSLKGSNTKSVLTGDSFVGHLWQYAHKKSSKKINLKFNFKYIDIGYNFMGGMTIEKYRRGGFEKRVAKRRPDSIIIIMGGNDLDSKFDGYPYYCTEDVFSAMRDLILWFIKNTWAGLPTLELIIMPRFSKKSAKSANGFKIMPNKMPNKETRTWGRKIIKININTHF